MSFSIATIMGLIFFPVSLGRLRGSPLSWINGIVGICGYHLLYFGALRNAPVAEASLVAYLWPLLIVLFSGFLPGPGLRLTHVLGAVVAFMGAGLLVTGGSVHFEAEHLFGYGLALGCAITWAVYSVMSRALGATPTEWVTAFCGASALVCWLAHGFWETTVAPNWGQLSAVFALGIGPLGLAFFAWDRGMKHGNVRVLGVLSYAAPLLSTLLLIISGHAQATPLLAIACALIVSGAALAALPKRVTSGSGRQR